MTISGGYDDKLGKVIAHGFWPAVQTGFNWGSDVQNAKTSTFQIKLNLPAGVSEDTMINRLIAAQQNFQANYDENQTVPYMGIPDLFGDYNSNSFQSGLLGAAGFTDLPDLHNAPGFGMPIPARMFRPRSDSNRGGSTFLNQNDDPSKSHLCTGSRIPTKGACGS
jgi:hypothetical protein